nr:helix-turn-helix domain-containing protein [uncultured Tolumonas sp.]
MRFSGFIEHPTIELPHLGFRRYLPHPLLQHWVHYYWTARQEFIAGTGVTETRYPDGGISLGFYFNDGFPSIELQTQQTTNKIRIEKTLDSMGVYFRPGGILKLFAIDINELAVTDNTMDILHGELGVIQYQLAELNHHSRMLLMENWLLEKCANRMARPGLVQHFVPQLLTSTQPLDELLNTQHLGRRQVERLFQQEIGLSPAQLRQLHRIKQARQLITGDPLRALTAVAQECGFYDQSHFIRQFQKVTGQTPGEYKNRKMSQKYNS